MSAKNGRSHPDVVGDAPVVTSLQRYLILQPDVGLTWQF